MKILHAVDNGLANVLMPESLDSLQAFLKKRENTHYLCLAIRHGAQECITLLEHRNYKPETERNKLFHFRVIEWQEVHMFMVSIPSIEEHFMESAASESGLRITDNIMIAATSDGFSAFPIHGDRIFMLVNVPGHPTYKNDPAVDEALRQSEKDALKRIRDGSR